MRLSLLTFAIIMLLAAPAAAQLAGADVAAGDSCAGSPTGATTMVADADGNRRGVILICNGSTWVVEQPTFTGACADNTAIVYDNATGGLRCGVVDNISPIWITPAGTIGTTDVNLTISETVAASDESGSPTYQKTTGDAWINVASNGLVTGRAPLTGGIYHFTVRATDGAGNTSDRIFDIVVNAGQGPGDCANAGDPCSDGTVYAGTTPDGDVDFFVTPNNAPGGQSYYFNDGSGDWLNSALPDCTIGGTQSTCRTGEYNTGQLINLDSASAVGDQIHQAALVCYCWGESHANAPDGVVPSACTGDPVGTNGLDGYGHDDWYLPSIAELDIIWVNLVAPSDTDNPTFLDGAGGGGFDAAKDGPQAPTFTGNGIRPYISSSELGSNNIWALEFDNDGEYATFVKANTANIRCARK